MTQWTPPSQRPVMTLSIPRAWLPLLALAAALAILFPATLLQRNRALQAELDRATEDLTATALRERDLEDGMVRQHRQLQEAQAQLETMTHQIDAIELQLDGVDFLAGQLRESMGLPPGSGTWDPAANAGQGGPGASAPATDRLAQAHMRLLTGMIEFQALQQKAAQDRAAASGSAAEAAAAPSYSRPANWPARGEVTSSFGWRVFRGTPNYHTGVDIGLPFGTPVQVTGDGMVVGAGWQPSYGWSVLVDHGQGYSSLYAHLSQTLAKVGDRVGLGDAVGLSGSSGNSTGPHLHYEIWKDGLVIDPRPLMDGSID